MSVSGASGSGSFTYQWYTQSGLVSAPSGSSISGWTPLGAVDGAIKGAVGSSAIYGLRKGLQIK